MLIDIKELFVLALGGQLHLTALDARWPNVPNTEEPYNTLYSDLSDAVEHTPGFFFKKGIDLETWRRQWEYHVILCDYLLLPYLSRGAPNWLSLRKTILNSAKKMNPITEEGVRNLIQHHIR
jgi:hypothetical protein